MTQDCVSLSSPSLGGSQKHQEIQTAYIARKDGNPVAIAITSTAPDGYNGNIELIIAINMDNSVSGVRVLKHQETPGLGDKVELRKSDWISSFNGKKMLSDNDSRWAVAKDGGMFDQFTGATITPRAVVKAVKKTVIYFKDNKLSLLASKNSCKVDVTEPQANIVDEMSKSESEVSNEQ